MSNQQKHQIKPSDLQDVVCEYCENQTFVPIVFIKRLSPLMSPDGQEKFVPLEAFACNSCGKVPQMLLKNIPFNGKVAGQPEDTRKEDSNSGIVSSNLEGDSEAAPSKPRLVK